MPNKQRGACERKHGAAVAITINRANTATSVTSSESPSKFGDSVTFTATVFDVEPAFDVFPG